MVNENHNLDNTVTMYLDYIRENQRLYRYIVENSSENERTLSNLVERQYYNNRNRIRRSISYDRNNRYSSNFRNFFSIFTHFFNYFILYLR